MNLDEMKFPTDISGLSLNETRQLAYEIRKFLIKSVSKTGGHLASNLGTIELTMALHLVLNFPKDKLIWDVGHQAYTHKLLTGRREGFNTLRMEGGMSGFPKRKESDCDSFDTGHSSTSISAGLGLAAAREITGEDYHVISVIGDGSLTGGMAYSKMLTQWITEYISYIAPVVVLPGENEMEALAFGGIRLLDGKEQANVYHLPEGYKV